MTAQVAGVLDGDGSDQHLWGGGGGEDWTRGLEGRLGSLILALLQVCFVVLKVS